MPTTKPAFTPPAPSTPPSWKPDPNETYSTRGYTAEDGTQRLYTLAEEAELFPPPDPNAPKPRVLIRKSTAIARVNAIGKIDAVSAALNSSPLAFAQWYAPDWPNVFADDPGLLAVLKGVGCTAAQIATVTAPDPTVVA